MQQINEWGGEVGTAWLQIFSEYYDDASTNNITSPAPPIASSDNFYITLTAELADDISLHHTVLTNSILHHVY